MGKALVIVESPAKAKTINKYLGKDYVVKSSVGHIRDLPTSGSASRKPAAAGDKTKKLKKTNAQRWSAGWVLTRTTAGKRIIRFCRQRKGCF